MNYLPSDLSVNEAEDGNPDLSHYQFHSSLEGRWIPVEPGLTHQPSGLCSLAIETGIKYDNVQDFAVVALDKLGNAAGVFTRNRSASSAVTIDREHLKNGKAQALVVISKNANVFTPTDYDDSMEIVNSVGEALNIAPSDILLSCTGVIGVPLPMDKIRKAIARIPNTIKSGLIDSVAEAILTTDKGPKTACVKFADVVIAGMAKGAGMIEPNMATMLAYLFTNLNIESEQLRTILKRVCDSTFNSISVDTDTSTSDSTIVFSTNAIEATDAHLQDFEKALGAITLKLARDIVYQAEGATKLVEVTVSGGRSDEHAKQVAKSIINSPLVKTAVFGADPNWGRIVMAMGKPLDVAENPFDPARIKISIAGKTMFEGGRAISLDLDELSKTIKNNKQINIAVDLGEGHQSWTVWGCDLSYKYVEVNAEYTT